MNRHAILFAASLLAPLADLRAAGTNDGIRVSGPPDAVALEVDEPLDYEVVQRGSHEAGDVRFRGRLAGVDATGTTIEVRLAKDGEAGAWRPLDARFGAGGFEGVLRVPAGGWYRAGVRVLRAGAALAESTVEHVGVGEVFVVAGQSNSANHGEERQSTKTGRAAAFDGKRWRLANDPQEGASGGGGSFLPPFGDAMAHIRAAQASLWKDGVALEGPDSDTLKGGFREAGGKGVHFSGPGLRANAAAWVDKVAPWLESRIR
jgi:hypothetical protein